MYCTTSAKQKQQSGTTARPSTAPSFASDKSFLAANTSRLFFLDLTLATGQRLLLPAKEPVSKA